MINNIQPEKHTLLKKISNNFMEKVQPIDSCWLLVFHIYEHTKAGLQKYCMHLNCFRSSSIRLKFNLMHFLMILFRVSAFAVNSVSMVQQRPYVSVSHMQVKPLSETLEYMQTETLFSWQRRTTAICSKPGKVCNITHNYLYSSEISAFQVVITFTQWWAWLTSHQS